VLSGTIGLVVAIVLILLAILWFILPFAIFGTKPIMRQKLAVDEEILEVEEEILHQLKAIRELLDRGPTPDGSGKTVLRAER
jgi:hypothetical protein